MSKRDYDTDDRVLLTQDEIATCLDIAQGCRNTAVYFAKLGQTRKARSAMRLSGAILRMINKSKAAVRRARFNAAHYHKSCQASDGTSTEVSP